MLAVWPQHAWLDEGAHDVISQLHCAGSNLDKSQPNRQSWHNTWSPSDMFPCLVMQCTGTNRLQIRHPKHAEPRTPRLPNGTAHSARQDHGSPVPQDRFFGGYGVVQTENLDQPPSRLRPCQPNQPTTHTHTHTRTHAQRSNTHHWGWRH